MSNKILLDFTKKLKSILKICPKNSHQLHEPLIENKDLVKIKESIKTGFVSTVGKHVDLLNGQFLLTVCHIDICEAGFQTKVVLKPILLYIV